MTKETSETYNGWTNRETWALALHLSNNEGDYDAASNQALYELRHALDETTDLPIEHTASRIALSCMTSWLEEWAQEVYDSVLASEEDTYGNSAARMLVSDVGSLWRVDFREIAEHYIDEAREKLA